MGTTAEKLQAIVAAKADIGAAITEKGGSVPQKLSECGNAIRALPSMAAPLAPLDAKKVYATLRDVNWPPMPANVPDHMLVFLYTGGGTAAFTVTCEGQYTVETKLCTRSGGTWTYTVESTEAFSSGVAYSKEIPATEIPEYRLITVSASSITDFAITQSGADPNAYAMRGCVELLCRLPSARAPRFENMKELLYATELGIAGGAVANSIFNGCSSLICLIGPDLQLQRSLSNAFNGCDNLIAVDISVSDDIAITASSAFSGCKKLSLIPESILNARTYNNAMKDCQLLQEASLVYSQSNSPSGFNGIFDGCISLQRVSISSVTGGVPSYWENTFNKCISLKRLVFDIQNWEGSDFSIANCAFDRFGLVEMFWSLPTITDSHSITITGNPGVAELTDADKAIATNKGWTLVLE